MAAGFPVQLRRVSVHGLLRPGLRGERSKSRSPQRRIESNGRFNSLVDFRSQRFGERDSTPDGDQAQDHAASGVEGGHEEGSGAQFGERLPLKG